MSELRPWHDVGGAWPSMAYGFLDDLQAAILLELFHDIVSHLLQFVETFSIGADKKDGYFVVAAAAP